MDKGHVELAGRLECFLNHVLSDGIEGDALVLLEVQGLFEVLCDRLAHTVGIGRQIDLIRAHARLEAVDRALAALVVLIVELVTRRGDCERFEGQVAHMASVALITLDDTRNCAFALGRPFSPATSVPIPRSGTPPMELPWPIFSLATDHQYAGMVTGDLKEIASWYNQVMYGSIRLNTSSTADM